MIERILVANRGEIARRIFRTCRMLGIATVAVFSEPDAAEPHPHEADAGIQLPGTTPAETYLNQDAILDAAKQSEADAIHPGYGFLAENAAFAREVESAGLTWIGPSPAAIDAMGSKIRAKEIMASAGVPMLASINLKGLEDAEMVAAAAEVGYPVMVKASAGGGGKGMRIVKDSSLLLEEVEGAGREAVAGFGDGTLFLERYLEAPRHVEIQVFGDSKGNIVSLLERECSIQRRHQKIIEECPSPAVDPALRAQMGAAAVKAAEAVDYTGAGTVEFLLQGGEFYFLEMNTRLQVEHPVTEMVTGLDLVELQIRVAEGEPLPPGAMSPTINGHAIEARLYAEDPANDFLPVTGRIHEFGFDETPGLRIDSGVEAGSIVTVNYDPMLAKVVAHAPDRTQAVHSLAAALRGARIHAGTTNRALLVRTLEHPDFLSGSINTHFLEQRGIEELSRPLATEPDEALAARAAAISDQAWERGRATVLATVPSGWRNTGHHNQTRVYSGELSQQRVDYRIEGEEVVFGDRDRVTTIESEPDRVAFDDDGTLHRFDVYRYGELRFVQTALVPARLTAVPRFGETPADEAAGSLHSPMPGTIVRVHVTVGDPVTEGETLMVLEAMKMEHTIRAPGNGVVAEILAAEGDQVEANSILVVVETKSAD